MKKLMLASFLLAGILGANAQTITVTAAGSVVSNTNDLSNSVRQQEMAHFLQEETIVS